MDNTSYIAISRQTALERQLEIVANNIANTNTPAFKSEDSLFTKYLVTVSTDDRLLRDKLSFVQDLGTVRNFEEGPMEATNNPLDVAIHGDGYFVVDTPRGERYTRGGHFRLDQDGQLVTTDGHPVLSADNNLPFFFAPNEAKINVARDGTVSTENGIVGKLRVVNFANPQDLRKVENGLYSAAQGQQPQEIAAPDIQQGMLEQSNVQPVMEMTKLIQLNRAYQGVSKMIEVENTRQRKAVDTLAKLAN